MPSCIQRFSFHTQLHPTCLSHISYTSSANIMVKEILDKVSHACCGALGLGDDDDDAKPMPIYGNPNKKPEGKEEAPQEQAPPAKPQEQAPPTKANKFSGTGKDTKYEDVKWADLPKEASEAAAVLGFDQEKWDSDTWIDIQDYWWEDLSEEQAAAATALGWDITSWDNKYEEASWKDVPESVKKAAESLGFTEEMWDDDAWPEGLCEKSYSDLTKDEAAAVAVLGYTKIDWDES